MVEDRGFERVCKIIDVVWGTSVDGASHIELQIVSRDVSIDPRPIELEVESQVGF